MQVVPVTGLGVALAAVATVGGVMATVNAAVPLMPPPPASGYPAVTVPLATDVSGAVNSPLALMVPALAVQVKLGCVARAAPNWSSATAVNCCTAPACRLADVGATTMDVSVWSTVTLTLLVAVKPPASVIVTWKE